MTASIDIDLIEIRCRVRGWRYERTFTDPREGQLSWTYALEIMTSDGQMYVRDDGEYGGDDAASERHEYIFTAPRLTLANIIEEPGKGWEVEGPYGCREWHFGWGEADTPDGPNWAALVVVDSNGRLLEPPRHFALPIHESTKAHRAVDDLLVRLAEVSCG